MSDELNLDPNPATDEPGFDLDPDGNVEVAGLRIPGPLALRIVEAMRGLYPTVTGELDGPAAVRAVLKYWVTSTLSTYEAQHAAGQVSDQISEIQQAAVKKGQAAMEKAKSDAAQIVETATSSAPPAS